MSHTDLRMKFKQLATPFADEMKAFVGELSGWAVDSSKRISGVEQQQLNAAFLLWYEEHFEDPQLKGWIGTLDPVSQRILIEQLTHFCADLGLELAWAVDGLLDADDPLARAIADTAENYCRACQVATGQYVQAQQFRRSRYLAKLQAKTAAHSDTESP